MPPSAPFSQLARPSVRSDKLWRPRSTDSLGRDRSLLWLDKNENGDPELLSLTRELLASISPDSLFTYPESGALYRKLASWLEVTPESIVLTAGSDGAIRSVFEAFIEPGDVVLHTSPTFAMYPVYSQMYGAYATVIDYQSSPVGPALSATSFIRKIEEIGPKLVCLPNPDSPTGTVFLPTEIESIICASNEVGALVLIDEAYHPFYSESVVPLIENYRNLIVGRTFAKAWGLAGFRIGYSVACEELSELLHKVRPMYEVNTIAVAMCERMLDHVDGMENSVRRLNEGKEFFAEEMQKMGFLTTASRGNFIHVAFSSHAEKIHSALSSRVLYRHNFKEPCLAGFSRFSAAPRDVMSQVVSIVESVVQQSGK